MGKIISVINQKGGVGKTTISFNLAKGLAKKNLKILIIDNDPQGNLTCALLDDPTKMKADVINFYHNKAELVKPENIDENLDFIGANIHLSKISDSRLDEAYLLQEGLEPLVKIYDYIIIDCNPSLGALNMAALIPTDYVLIPIKPAPFAIIGLHDLFETVNRIKKRINKKLKILGIIINDVNGRKTIIEEEVETVLRNDYSDLVFNTIIPHSISMVESPTMQKSIMEYDPRGKQAKQFSKFVVELMERL
jgi:chromosome partitioning protein